MMMRIILIAILFAFVSITNPVTAQLSDSVIEELEFREVGPWRGGRSTAVVGHPEKKDVYYFGAAGGGVWQSTDSGQQWKNISDGYFGGSIGAIALAPTRPLTIYVGGGENSLRGNVSSGNGIWKSTDGGRTWTSKGLLDSRHIMRIIVHPENPEVVYCTALGHLYGKNTERGIYKSIDGGDTWNRMLYLNDSVGACDLVMDPVNPNILVATFWNIKRTPYSLESGGEGSSVWKTIDGGKTWTDLSGNPGLPKGDLGIIGVSISDANPDLYFAIIEAKDGGLFKSIDAGENWEKINSESDIRQRAWYYSKVFTDPENTEVVYVLNVQFWKSTDGGKTFKSIRTPHGDHHDLWIDSNAPQRMIIGDDGGAQVSLNGGESWTTYYNQPTAQIYRVSTDNNVPYRILGAQQDNTSLRIFHRSKDGAIDRNDWEPTAGFESGYIVAHPDNPDIVYGGNYSGFIGCLNHINGDRRNITVWPNDPIGQGAIDQKYRFQWNFPLFFSPHNSNRLYAAGNILFYSDNNGDSWTQISPDLTTNDRLRQQPSGGIITKDNTGVEVYCTIFAAAESTLEEGVILAGTDDGLLHITRNGGEEWNDITPNDLPKWTQINAVEFDPFDSGRIYFVATSYKSDDYSPYLFTSKDYGKTWSKITSGIGKEHFTRVIRADKHVPGLLYCGTEYGLYLSRDYGKNWKRWSANLPGVPITDITIKENDLIIATQGRGFWILDNLSVVQRRMEGNNKLGAFASKTTWLIPQYQRKDPVNAGENPLPGVHIRYYLNDIDSVDLEVVITDNELNVIDTYSTSSEDENHKIEIQKGFNDFNWDLNYPSSEKVEGMFLWNGIPSGPRAAPGNYFVRFISANDSVVIPFELKADPGSNATEEDLKLQFQFLFEVQQKFDETQDALKTIQKVRKQINDYLQVLDDSASLAISDTAKKIVDSLTSIENVLYETRNSSSQDMLNYGIKLNDKLAGVYNAAAYGQFKPSAQVKAVYTELSAEIDRLLDEVNRITTEDINRLNELIHLNKIPVIVIKDDSN